MKVSADQKGKSESYAVKFWYVNDEGFYQQGEKLFYANSRCAHKVIERYAITELRKTHKNVRIINVTYQ